MSGYLTRQMLNPVQSPRAANDGRGRFRQWLSVTIRRWQRRRMAEAFYSLDDRMLADIGMCRADIPRVVNELTDRELRMNPPKLPTITANTKKADNQAGECKIAA